MGRVETGVERGSNPVKTVKRSTVLNAIFANFQMATQWPANVEGKDYIAKAESLIELLEVADCGSTGGFDDDNPRTSVTNHRLFDRFLTVLRKYPQDEKKIESRCGADVNTLTEYFGSLVNLRTVIYRKHPAAE